MSHISFIMELPLPRRRSTSPTISSTVVNLCRHVGSVQWWRRLTLFDLLSHRLSTHFAFAQHLGQNRLTRHRLAPARCGRQ
ncbi:MAG: hypothetical protein [Caudoviricetes sp.]|nr:MAG: hypothetical protein [Caudoviricetes sp.]